MKHVKFRSLLSCCLAVVMLLTCTCSTAFASETTEVSQDTEYAVSIAEGDCMPEGTDAIIEDFGNTVGDIAMPASSYTSSGSFKVELKTSNRSFDGTDMHCYISTYNSAGTSNNYPTVFYVSLYRYHWYGSELIGKVEVSRSGSYTITWSNVGSGTYYFVFTKANDGTTQYLSTVKYYN